MCVWSVSLSLSLSLSLFSLSLPLFFLRLSFLHLSLSLSLMVWSEEYIPKCLKVFLNLLFVYMTGFQKAVSPCTCYFQLVTWLMTPKLRGNEPRDRWVTLYSLHVTCAINTSHFHCKQLSRSQQLCLRVKSYKHTIPVYLQCVKPRFECFLWNPPHRAHVHSFSSQTNIFSMELRVSRQSHLSSNDMGDCMM